MKKTLALILALLLTLTCTACGSGTETAEPTPTPEVTAAPTPTPEPTPVPGWKEVTVEYEAWVTEYMDTYSAAINNPTDNAVYDKLEDLADQASKWDKRLTDLEMELVGAPDLQEYVDEVLRITAKLNDFVQSKNT